MQDMSVTGALQDAFYQQHRT